MIRRRRPAREGVAAIELAFVFMLFIVPMMLGVWELGRLIQVQQIVSNAAREGARTAGQGYTLKSDGTPIEIRVATGTPCVKTVVYQYLIAAGLTNLAETDVDVVFTFTAASSTGATPTEPYLGEKGQPFTVTVTIPWAKVRWVNLGLIRPTSVTFTVTWQMLIDDKFNVNDTLPAW